MNAENSTASKEPTPLRAVDRRKPPGADKQRDEYCRVFVSRKTSDRDVFGSDSSVRKQLAGFAAGRLEFFDAEGIPPGEFWRQKIRDEIQKADILLLILTRPARKDFDWPLYEAGLFDSLRSDGSLVCIYPQGSNPPDQLRDVQGVEATNSKMLKLLERLYTDNEFTNTRTALNSDAFQTFHDAMDKIASNICDQINGVKDDSTAVAHYANPCIQLTIKPGLTALDDDAEVQADQRTLRTLFQLGMTPVKGAYWTWADIKTAVALGERDPLDFNSRWIREVEAWVTALKQGKAADRQITGRFIAGDDRLWGPEVEIWWAYENGKTRIEITFSPEVHDAWLQKATVPVALAANLGLASRIRHDILETYLKRVPSWPDGDPRFDELSELVAIIEHDGFFIRWLTRDRYSEAFSDRDHIKQLRALEQNFGTQIYPLLHSGLRERLGDDVSEALRLWRANNAKFLSVAIPQYQELLRLEDIHDAI